MTEQLRKKNNTIFLTTTKDNQLSIRFNLDGFSFSIYNTTSQKELYFQEYIFEEEHRTTENLLLKIKEAFNTNTNLQLDFSSVVAIHQNSLSTLVPNAFFDENKLASYLNFNIKTLATDFVTFDDLENIEAKNVYIPYVNVNNYLFQNFGEFEYKHHSTVLIEKLLKSNKNSDTTMFVNVSKNILDIVILEKNNLILSNSFSYSTKEDFIYYILFVAEQLDLDTHNFSLYFTGDITLESSNYKITYQYIKNVYFLESTNPIFNQLNIPSHTNFILLGS